MRGNDLSNKKFGRLLVLKRVPSTSKSIRWLCLCDCGKHKEVESYQLKRGSIISCGCYKKEIGKRSETHNMTNTHLYSEWTNMKRRCYQKSINGFDSYGGRGIIVCDEWKNSFENFMKWSFKNDYDESLTLERIDVNGNYEPSNCSWITIKKQQWNKRNTIFIEFDNEIKSLCEWCEILGVNKNTARWRYYKGLSSSEIFSL